MSKTVSRSRRGRLLRFAAALVVLLAVASYVGVQYLNGGGGASKCQVTASGTPDGEDADDSDGDGDRVELTPEQAGNAATISAVGITRGMPERAVAIALATSLQESALRNLGHGDRDSLGLFQQRPSAGWGTAAQILDPVYSAGQFYARLAKIPGYSRLPLTVAAQQVQHSGYPQAYAKHEPDATLLAAAFTGRAEAVLTCPGPGDSAPGDPEKVRAALVRAFGPKVLPSGGNAAGSDSTGAGDVPAADASKGPGSGRSGVTQAKASSTQPGVVSVPVQALPGTDGGERGEMAGTGAAQRGWELAHWAVAQASALHIDQVSYAGRVWRAANASAGWQRVSKTGGTAGSTTSEVRITTAQ